MNIVSAEARAALPGVEEIWNGKIAEARHRDSAFAG
jgi:hypothetical protein